MLFMNLTHAMIGITQEDSRFDFVGRVRVSDFSLELLIDLLLSSFKKRLEGCFNDLSHENLFVFILCW